MFGLTKISFLRPSITLLILGLAFSSGCSGKKPAKKPAGDKIAFEDKHLGHAHGPDEPEPDEPTESEFMNPDVPAPVQIAEAGGPAVDLGPTEPYKAGSSPETERVGEDWPWFLGLRGTGISAETNLVDSWGDEGPPILWKARIGSGYAAPSIRGNRLVLFHRDSNEEVIECFTADTGEWLWRNAFYTEFEDPYGYSNGPRCTPLITKDRVYIHGAEGRLACLELATGKTIWMRETMKDFKIPQSFFGVGSTPVIEGNLLIVAIGAVPNAGIVAFNAHTGETVWKGVSNENFEITFTGREKRLVAKEKKVAGYASLTSADIHGKRHVLAFMRQGLVSINPKTGAINFTYFYRSPISDSVNAAVPVVVDDLIFLSAAYETGAVVLKVNEDGNGYEVVWKNARAMLTHWSTATHDAGFLYGFSGRHEAGSTFRCISLNTGKLAWQTESNTDVELADPRDGKSSVAPDYYGRGSAIVAQGKFVVLGERGELALVNINSQKFEEICRHKFPDMRYPSWTAPVLSRGRLYIRCEDEPNSPEYWLLCIDLAKKAETAPATGE